jgi:ubiquitin carboxyl-terminal hydrolase 31
VQSSKQRSTAKLTTLVDFPLYGFDMSPHLARRARGGNEGGGVPGGLGWSPWKRPRRQTSRHEDNVYDLYAICNHHGQDLQGGHYTGQSHCSLGNCIQLSCPNGKVHIFAYQTHLIG